MESLQSAAIKFFTATAIVLSFLLVSRGLPASPEHVVAAQLIKEKHFLEAIAHLNRSIKSEPNRIVAYVLRASAYNSIGQYDKAIQDCETAMRLNPHEPRAWTKRAYAYIGQERYFEAIGDCDRAILMNPKLAQAYEYRALAHKKSGKCEIALEDLNRAKELKIYGASIYR
ncbi:MAG: hypothetical protein JST89_20410 [Cyanobacteria bacterium SZAS-4]|nr:hypothetical protein [Cyanobacteria bacterium SZAS-4]